MIALAIHSALDAFGSLAAITTELAREGIGVNPVADYHHDYLFVPHDCAEDPLQALQDLAAAYGPREALAT